MSEHPAEEAVADCVGALLDQAMDLTVRFLTDRPVLSVSAALTMNRVSREGPIRLTALAMKEGMTQPSMTEMIQRLVSQGLMIKSVDPDDGRAALIDITGQGQALLDSRKGPRRARLAEFLQTLSPEEQSALWLSAQVGLPILQRLIANADSEPRRCGGTRASNAGETLDRRGAFLKGK